MHSHIEAERVCRCIWRPWSCELRGGDRASSKTSILWVGRCTWRLWLCELGGCNRARLEIHLEAVIQRVRRCTCRPWGSEIGVVLGGCQSGGGSYGRRRDRICDCSHWLTRNRGNVENWVLRGLPKDERLAGSGRQSIWGWCSTRCILYAVYAGVAVCSTRCRLYSESTGLGLNTWSWHGEIESTDLTSCF